MQVRGHFRPVLLADILQRADDCASSLDRRARVVALLWAAPVDIQRPGAQAFVVACAFDLDEVEATVCVRPAAAPDDAVERCDDRVFRVAQDVDTTMFVGRCVRANPVRAEPALTPTVISLGAADRVVNRRRARLECWDRCGSCGRAERRRFTEQGRQRGPLGVD